jgi:hypothetical protein
LLLRLAEGSRVAADGEERIEDHRDGGGLELAAEGDDVQLHVLGIGETEDR